MCEASHMKFDPDCHQISQVYMYENVTSGPLQFLQVDVGNTEHSSQQHRGWLYRQQLGSLH